MRAVLSSFLFAHQHYSTTSLRDGERCVCVSGGGGVLFKGTSSILMFCPAQLVWQNYSGRISVVGKEKKNVITKTYPLFCNTEHSSKRYLFFFLDSGSSQHLTAQFLKKNKKIKKKLQ